MTYLVDMLLVFLFVELDFCYISSSFFYVDLSCYSQCIMAKCGRNKTDATLMISPCMRVPELIDWHATNNSNPKDTLLCSRGHPGSQWHPSPQEPSICFRERRFLCLSSTNRASCRPGFKFTGDISLTSMGSTQVDFSSASAIQFDEYYPSC